jgi:hypothetical protein
VSGAWLPATADLDAATARTAATIDDPDASLADVEFAAELEEAAYSQIEPGPCDRLADPPVAESQIDWTPEVEAEIAEAAAELEAAL